MSEITLNTQKREVSTKGAVNKLRREGHVPGVFYSEGKEAQLFSVPELSIKPLIYTSETHIVQLIIDKQKPQPCILKEIQFDPVTDKIIHIDLQGLTAGHQLQLQIPVVLTGKSVGVIKEGGVLQQAIHKLDIECLPRHIPEHIEIDISDLKIGDVIHVREIPHENFKIINPEDVLVVAVNAPRKEAVVEQPVEEALLEGEESKEPEVIGKGKTEESKEEQ